MSENSVHIYHKKAWKPNWFAYFNGLLFAVVCFIIIIPLW